MASSSPLVVALVAAAVVAVGAAAWVAASSRARTIESCLDDVVVAGDAAAQCPGTEGNVRALRVLGAAGLVAMFAGVFVAGALLVTEQRAGRRSRRRAREARGWRRARPRFDDAPAAVVRPPKPVASGRHCARCSAALFVGEEACRSCGARVTLECAICGADIRNAREKCPSCGMGLGVS